MTQTPATLEGLRGSGIDANFDLPRLEVKGEMQEPMSKTDLEYERAVISAKCQALESLCKLQGSGKGGDKVINLINVLAAQVTKL